MGHKISFAEWSDAVERWHQRDNVARRVVCCIVCWIQVPDFRNSDPTRDGICLFDICESCVEKKWWRVD